jgi:hypothetical protein
MYRRLATASEGSSWASRAADVIITMGCGDASPMYAGKRYEDWDLTDPAGQSLDVVRDIPRRPPSTRHDSSS